MLFVSKCLNMRAPKSCCVNMSAFTYTKTLRKDCRRDRVRKLEMSGYKNTCLLVSAQQLSTSTIVLMFSHSYIEL